MATDTEQARLEEHSWPGGAAVQADGPSQAVPEWPDFG